MANTLNELERSAERIAREAFGNRLDRSGNPIIHHTERVARNCVRQEDRVAAWLHDVVEDTDVTLDDLRTAGFPEVIVGVIDSLTRREGESYSEFIERIATNPNAVPVKLSDLKDNLGRCHKLPNKEEGEGLARRYVRAIARLEGLQHSSNRTI